MIERQMCKDDAKELIVYGLMTGIELFFNIITTLIFGIVFGQVLESFVFLFSFSLIRIYAGGYHCKKAGNCYCFSNGIVVLVLTIIMFTPKESTLFVSVMILLLSIPVIIKFAPIETASRPLDNVEKVYFRKKTVIYLSIECIGITVLDLCKLYIYGYVICLGITVTAALIILQRRFA